MKKLDVYLQEIKRQKISVDDLQHAAEILAATPQLPAELENPDLTREKREDLVRSLFPLAVRGIIEVLAQDQTMKMMPDLIKEAEAFEKPDKYLRCVLEYVKEPDEKQAAGIRKFLSEKYPGRELRIVKEIWMESTFRSVRSERSAGWATASPMWMESTMRCTVRLWRLTAM